MFKLEVKPNSRNDFFLQRTKLLYEKEDLAQSEQADLEKKETMYCHYVTKQSSVLCYELVRPRKCHSHDIKTG